MSALKMFFCIVSETRSNEITVHRELNSIYTLWNNESSDNKVGIIHIGFIRPKVPSYEEIQHFHGGILVSESVKFSLPSEYNTGNNSVFGSNKNRLFQLLTGFGYNIDIADDEEYVSEDLSNETPLTSGSKHTIASAALEVLESVAKPMSKEEIYGHIIERNLFQFGAKKPINVLNVELNRHCEGTEYSQASSNKFFGKINAELFYALSTSSREFDGWLTILIEFHPKLAVVCSNLGIFDEKLYFKNKKFLSDTQIRELELIRFRELKASINVEDPSELIPLLPVSILEANISQLGLTVRTSNVFSVKNIFTLKGAIGYSLKEMMTWPNFGKKSAKDLCEVLDASVEKLSFMFPINFNVNNEEGTNVSDEKIEVVVPDASNFDHASKTTLKQHFENSLSVLKNKDRKVLECRTGYREPVKTLEEVGKIINLTRERVRQIQKKNVSKIINTEYWDDCIALKVGKLLLSREQPLYLEMLEIEDDWFTGFIGNYQHLAAIIELFSENQIKFITINGAVIISRICQEDWDNLVGEFKKSLKNKAKEQIWTKSDINLTFTTSLEDKGALELLPVLWDLFNETLQFSTQNNLLVAYGKTGESAVYTVLQQAESPLHYSEVALRASVILGKKVEERLAHNSMPRLGAKLFGRGQYGLAKFNPISDTTCNHIRLVLGNLLYDGPLGKQWHVTELLNNLKERFPSLPKELDMYLLNIILEDSERLTYLNKNVWARKDSGQLPTDRVDMADAFTKILEDAGKPLKGKEIKAKLEEIRGVHESLQIQPTERMLQVGPDTWGLLDRDVVISEDEQAECFNKLFNFLTRQEIGIHITEVKSFLEEEDLSNIQVGNYALLNLAQRDERFYLGRSMFLGLAEWGEDTRRFTFAQAIRKILQDMKRPMHISEINAQVEMLTGLEVDSAVTGLLINEGGRYDSSKRLWEKAT
jgi:hypothetical protein